MVHHITNSGQNQVLQRMVQELCNRKFWNNFSRGSLPKPPIERHWLMLWSMKEYCLIFATHTHTPFLRTFVHHWFCLPEQHFQNCGVLQGIFVAVLAAPWISLCWLNGLSQLGPTILQTLKYVLNFTTISSRTTEWVPWVAIVTVVK